MIPKEITREHVLQAMEEINHSEIPAGRDFVKHYLLFENKKYPPKYVISLASKYATGRELSPGVCSGGTESNAFLERLGFSIGRVLDLQSSVIPSKSGGASQVIKENLPSSRINEATSGERSPTSQVSEKDSDQGKNPTETPVKSPSARENYQSQSVIGRIVIKGEWRRKPSSARNILRSVTVRARAQGLHFRYLITCGGFLHFPWPKSMPVVDDPKYPSAAILKDLTKCAKQECERVIKGSLLQELKNVTRYLTIGIDSVDPRSPQHAELVALVDLKVSKYYWTGKIYPHASQEKDLIRFSDLDSHFLNLQGERVMMLGCHDLNLFSPRAEAVAGRWRSQLIKEFRRHAKHFKPTIVLQHPHSSDSPNVWNLAWKTLEKELRSVEHYASAGLYYNGGWRCRGKLKDVLRKTKRGNVVDYVLKP